MSIITKVKSFQGGIHPNEYKNLTKDLPFERMANPKQIILPLSQHIGKPSKSLVVKKDTVKIGQLVAESEGFVSAPIHSSISGTVKLIENEANVSGFPKKAIVFVIYLIMLHCHQ